MKNTSSARSSKKAEIFIFSGIIIIIAVLIGISLGTFSLGHFSLTDEHQWQQESYGILMENSACDGDLPTIKRMIFVGETVDTPPNLVEVIYTCRNGQNQVLFWEPNQPNSASIQSDRSDNAADNYTQQ